MTSHHAWKSKRLLALRSYNFSGTMMSTYNGVVRCSQCNRAMVISIIQFGVSHVADTLVRCPDCTEKIDWNEKYFVDNPDEAERIKNLLKEEAVN